MIDDTNTTEVAATPPMVTVAPLMNPVPARFVIAVPPEVLPVFGVIAVTVGSALYV